MEPLLRDIRLGMDGAGMYCEGVKGECNFGQQEIAFRYAEALETCDNHTIYKNGAKEIADQHGKALTFMAKFNEREGNSCHIHLSVRGEDGEAGHGRRRRARVQSTLMEHWIAGILATLRELTLLYAPERSTRTSATSKGSFAPDRRRVGPRQPHLRAARRRPRPSLRVENRVPGGDVNPYLAIAAIIAGGLHGIENELPMPADRSPATPTRRDVDRVPTTLREAAELFAESADRARGLRRRDGRALPQQGARSRSRPTTPP